MKKLIAFAFACAFAVSAFAYSADTRAVYNFKMSLKTPTLWEGVRQYKSQTYKGYMYADYSDTELVRVWAEVQSSATKVTHVIEFDVESGFYNLMGKSNSKCERTVPTLWFKGNDVETVAGSKYGDHETITNLVLAGSGSIKSVKVVSEGCTICGTGYPSVWCNTLKSASGYATGVMNSECPDWEDWDHTLKGGACGPTDERSHFAATFGSWSISYKNTIGLDD